MYFDKMGKSSSCAPAGAIMILIALVLGVVALGPYTSAASENGEDPKQVIGDSYCFTGDRWIKINNEGIFYKWCCPIPYLCHPCKPAGERVSKALRVAKLPVSRKPKPSPLDDPSKKKAYVYIKPSSNFSAQFDLHKTGNTIFRTYPLANYITVYTLGGVRLPGGLKIIVSGYSKYRKNEPINDRYEKEVRAKKVVTRGPGELPNCDNCSLSLFAFPYTEAEGVKKQKAPMYVESIEVRADQEWEERICKSSPVSKGKKGDGGECLVGIRNLGVFLDKSVALDLYEEARKLFEKNDFGGALEKINSALIEDPYSLKTHLLKVKILEELNRMDGAYNTIKRAVQVAEDFPSFVKANAEGKKTEAQVYMKKAHFDYRRERLSEAIGMSKKAIRKLAQLDDDDPVLGQLPSIRTKVPSRYVNFLAKSYLRRYELRTSSEGDSERGFLDKDFKKAVEVTLQAMAESPIEILNYGQKFNTKAYYRQGAIYYLDSILDHISEKTYDLEFTNKIESYPAYYAYALMLYRAATTGDKLNEYQLLEAYSAIQFGYKVDVNNTQMTLLNSLESEVLAKLQINPDKAQKLRSNSCKFFQDGQGSGKYGDWIKFLSC